METKSAQVDLTMDAAWYSKFTERVTRVGTTPKQVCDVLDESEQVRGFDDADAMEAGEVRFTAILLLQPPVLEQRLIVLRSSEYRMTTLLNAAGETLLVSRASADGRRFDIYMSRDGRPVLQPRAFLARSTPPEPEPAFTLMASDSERNDWALISLQCEGCAWRGRRQCGARHIMRTRHYLEAVGAGQAFCMDVLFPRRAATGMPADFCQSCSCEVASWCKELTSRRPKWNLKHKSLSLDFRGRATRASAKNFQLESMSCKRPLFLYGKVDDDKFVLDYCAPLGTVQAFAAALSVSHWQ